MFRRCLIQTFTLLPGEMDSPAWGNKSTFPMPYLFYQSMAHLAATGGFIYPLSPFVLSWESASTQPGENKAASGNDTEEHGLEGNTSAPIDDVYSKVMWHFRVLQDRDGPRPQGIGQACIYTALDVERLDTPHGVHLSLLAAVGVTVIISLSAMMGTLEKEDSKHPRFAPAP